MCCIGKNGDSRKGVVSLVLLGRLRDNTSSSPCARLEESTKIAVSNPSVRVCPSSELIITRCFVTSRSTTTTRVSNCDATNEGLTITETVARGCLEAVDLRKYESSRESEGRRDITPRSRKRIKGLAPRKEDPPPSAVSRFAPEERLPARV